VKASRCCLAAGNRDLELVHAKNERVDLDDVPDQPAVSLGLLQESVGDAALVVAERQPSRRRQGTAAPRVHALTISGP
jgi:hypothetical protein